MAVVITPSVLDQLRRTASEQPTVVMPSALVEALVDAVTERHPHLAPDVLAQQEEIRRFNNERRRHRGRA